MSSDTRCLTRRDFLRLGAGAAGSMLVAPLLNNFALAAEKKPNIIFILADDLGWGDLGCYGHPHIKTPNLDRLAKQGTRFTNFYACGPVCSPSRAACVTGMFPSRTRIHYALPNQLDEPHKQAGMAEFLDPIWMTIPRALKNGGYTTAHIGKWHLGTSPSAPEVTEYGFDVSKAILGKPNAWKDGPKNDPYFRAHSTGLFVDEGIRFIENNRERPFFLNLWTLAPHATLQPTPEQMKPYSGPQFNPGEQTGYSGAMAVYYSVVTDMDAQIGRLLDKLDELKLSDNTIVIFSSDNGPEDIHISNASHSGVGTPGPFRGRKRSLYDGGIRMPFIVRWPGMVPAGLLNDSSVLAGVDLLPTFAAIAGTTLPKDTTIDGEDVSDILKGSAQQRKTTLYWEYRFAVAGDTINRSPQLAIREDNWKLLMNRDGSRVELYDLSRTHTEVDNLADQHPDVVKRLSEKLLTWKKTLPPGEYQAGSGSDSYPWPK